MTNLPAIYNFYTEFDATDNFQEICFNFNLKIFI